MSNVRSKTGIAVESDFTDPTGTPIVVNRTNGSAYVMKTDGTIVAIGGGGGGGMVIGDPVTGGTVKDILFVGVGGVLAQNDFIVIDSAQYRVGIGESTPAQALHVVGNFRVDSPGHLINWYFGTTVSSTDGALIQFRDPDSYGFGNGAVVAGLGTSSASWGWTENGLILNTGAHLAFGDANIQAGLTEILGVYACSGAPSNLVGNNGDVMLRNDGAATSTIYQKVAGSWVVATGVTYSGVPPISVSGSSITTSMATNKLIGRTSASTGVMEEIAVAANLDLSSTTLTVKPKPKGVWVESPTATEKIQLFFNPIAWTLTEIRSVLPGASSTPSCTFSIRYGTDVSGAGTEVVTGGIATTSTTTGDSTTAFTNATLPAGNFVWITTTATSGTIPALSVTLE